MTPRAYTTVLAWAAREGLREHMACLQLLHVVEPAPGVLLLCLPVARRGYHGCYLHLGRATKRAVWWLDRLHAGGYTVSIGLDQVRAREWLRWHLERAPRREKAAA
jgi:hypothetical protein